MVNSDIGGRDFFEKVQRMLSKHVRELCKAFQRLHISGLYTMGLLVTSIQTGWKGFFSLHWKWKRACWLWYPDICLSLSVMKAWSVLRVQIGSAFHSDTCMSLMTPVPGVGSSLASPFFTIFPNLNCLPLSKGPPSCSKNIMAHAFQCARSLVEAKCQSEVSTTCVRLLDASNGGPGNTKASWIPQLRDFHSFPVAH